MSTSGRNRGRKDRFYSPPAMRKNHQHQQQLQQQQQQQQLVESPKHQEKKEQSESLMSSSSSNSSIPITNLDRFMKHTTPIVAAQHFPKTKMKNWRNSEDDYHPYFGLSDVWESFKEWSAYGVGVPLVLNEQDSVVQYYAPSLSAIQLYVDPSSPATSIRRAGEESDYESSRASSSDEGNEAKNVDFDVNIKRFNKLTLTDSSDESDITNPPGLLVFEYFERISPFLRAPLANKISELESQFPKLKTLRSCDLTQSSWLSVAWYPIYRIPLGPSLQNMDTCFLTFHSLSTPLKSGSDDEDWVHPNGLTAKQVHEGEMPSRLPLSTFGLAVYKFKNADWTQGGVHGTEKINSLIYSTENWLRKLDVHHPDYVFFKNH